MQRSAVDAALDGRTNVGFGDREALAALTDEVVAVDGDSNPDRYVPRLVTVGCDTPHPEIALAGFATGLVGVFLTSYAVVRRRLS